MSNLYVDHVEDDKAKRSVSLSLKTKANQTHRFIKPID